MTEDDDALAAEYVLGTLAAHEADAVRRRLEREPALADAVQRWEEHLAPLSRLALPESPPTDLWGRIDARIAPPPPRATFRPPRRSWAVPLLGGWATAATAAAALLLFAAPRPPPPPLMTVMLTDRTQAAWTAAFDRDGAIRLAAVPPVGGAPDTPVPNDRALQLWVLPPGATAPTSLGLLPRGERRITVAAPPVRPVPGMLIEITLEPQGGSPIGRPTGPVLFIGRLSEAGPPT